MMTAEEELQYLYDKFDRDVKTFSRLTRTLIAIDQLFNVILWNGSQDQTISANIHRRQTLNISTKFENLICKGLRFLESKHCLKSKFE